MLAVVLAAGLVALYWLVVLAAGLVASVLAVVLAAGLVVLVLARCSGCWSSCSNHWLLFWLLA